MSFLPTELVHLILNEAYYTQGAPDRPTMKACSLVSTDWTDASQRLLFHNVRLPGTPSRRIIESFYAACDPLTQRGRVLGSYVRRFTLSIGTLSSYGMHDLVSVLSRCPQLYELVLSVYGIHQISPKEFEDLVDATHGGPVIRALTLQRCGVQSPILYQLLNLWSSIRFLRLESELAVPPPAWPIKCSLYEIVLSRTPATEILRWLLSASSTTLRIAEFRDLPGAPSNDLFAALGPQLRSLRLICYNMRSRALINHCCNLEELVLYQLSNFMSMTNLPASIEHLSFRNPSWSPVTSLATVLAAIDTLPRLRLVSCDPPTAEHGDFAALKQKCLQRKITLNTDAFPIWIPEDPVPIRRFPRYNSASNFPLMNLRND